MQTCEVSGKLDLGLQVSRFPGFYWVFVSFLGSETRKN